MSRDPDLRFFEGGGRWEKSLFCRDFFSILNKKKDSFLWKFFGFLRKKMEFFMQKKRQKKG